MDAETMAAAKAEFLSGAARGYLPIQQQLGVNITHGKESWQVLEASIVEPFHFGLAPAPALAM